MTDNLPKIGLRNVKVAAFASHETHCFEATLTLDGKAVAIVGNEGMGGADHYRYLGGWTDADRLALNEQLKAGPRVEAGYDDDDGKPETIENDLEIVVGELVNEWVTARELRRLIVHKVLFVKAGEAGLWEVPLKSKGQVRPYAMVMATVEKRHPGCTVLNKIEFEKALALFRKHAGG